MLEQGKALLERTTGQVFSENQLRQARELAAAFIAEEGCKGAGHAQWASKLSPANVQHTESSIRRERDALARMYRINSEQKVLDACADLAARYAEDHPEFAAMFRGLPQQGPGVPFDTFRNKLEQIFAKNAGDMMLLRTMSLEPQ
jgi:hypothetical protein